MSDTGWIDVARKDANSFVAYRKKNGFVTIVGSSYNGWSIGAGKNMVIGTLPNGVRPPFEIKFIATTMSASQYEMHIVLSPDNGGVKIFNDNPSSATSYWGFTATYPV